METKLSINDIVQIRNIIDVCSKRGSFQASEMELVGSLYNKIKALTDEYESLVKKQKEEQEQAQENKTLDPVPEEPNEGTVGESTDESNDNNVSMNIINN